MAVRKRRPKSGGKRRLEYRLLMRFTLGIIVVLLAVSLFAPDRDFSADENRTLARFPALSSQAVKDGTWFEDLNSWFSDQFAFRGAFMSMRTAGQRAMGRLENNGVIFGKEGYLLQRPAVMNSDAARQTQQAINSFAKKYPDLNTCMVLVPDCAAAFPSYLPEGAPAADQLADISSFTGGLDSSIKVVDAAAALQADGGQQVYYKTDHHWTSRGACDVFMAAAKKMDISTDGKFKVYQVSDSFQGTMASKSGVHTERDSIEVYAPENNKVQYLVDYPDLGTRTTSVYDSSKLKEKDQYTVFFGGNHPLVEIRTTTDTGKNLLVFKDSYANSFVPFLIPYYDRIIMIDPRYYYEDPKAQLALNHITDVLYLYSADTLLTDTSLKDVLGGEDASESQ